MPDAAGIARHPQHYTCWEDNSYGQDHWNRPGHHKLLCRRDGRRRTGRDCKRRRQPDHAVHRRLRQGRRTAGGRHCQAPSRHQSAEHRILDQALHGPPPQRGGRGREDRALQGDRLRLGRLRDTRHGQDVPAAGSLGHGPAENERDRRGLPGRRRQPGGDHGACVFQRLTAPGD